jgi:hypothetical protein
MANGDITSIKILGRVVLPGGGQTNTGVAKQNKTIVWGEIIGTSAATGFDLAGYESGGVKMLGLETLDVIDFEFRSVSGSAMANDKLYLADLNRDTNKIFMLEDVGAADSIVPTAGDTIKLRFLAIGDAHVAELT